MKILRALSFIGLISAALFSGVGNTVKGDKVNDCFQDKEAKLRLIKKAEDAQYNIRNIYIVGNTFTRYRTFRKQMVEDFDEGFIFTEKHLMKSIEGINELKTINPISLEDVKVQIERDAFRDLDVIDFDICVEEK